MTQKTAILKISYRELAAALGLPPDTRIVVCMQTHSDMLDGYLRLGIDGDPLPLHPSGAEAPIVLFAEYQREDV